MTKCPDGVSLTQELLRFNTINPPGQEAACARHLGDLLTKAGFRCDYLELGPNRLSLVAKIGGLPGRLPLGFTGHIDTVPLGGARWRKDAFGESLEGGKLFGRGSSDMKSGVAAFVVAAISQAEKLKNSAGLTLVITADEECGCGGAKQLVADGKLLGQVGALVVGEPTTNYPLVGHKGALWLEAIARGVTAHGSMPERGDNAIYKAAKAVTALQHFHFGDCQHALMGKPTLNVGNIVGGLNINSVPDQATIGIDIRSVAGMSHSDIRSQVQACVGPEIEINTLVDVNPLFTEPGSDWVQQVFGVMEKYLGEAPQAKTVSYFTDAAILNQTYKNTPTVVLGPGEAHMAHQTDEYCVVDRVEQGVQAYQEIIRAWIH
jgi:succinyl-diaminopimelate desuccinylase